jgi:hypothetical protein
LSHGFPTSSAFWIEMMNIGRGHIR